MPVKRKRTRDKEAREFFETLGMMTFMFDVFMHAGEYSEKIRQGGEALQNLADAMGRKG